MVLSVNATSAWRAAGSEFVPVSDRLLRMRLRMHSGYVSVMPQLTRKRMWRSLSVSTMTCRK